MFALTRQERTFLISLAIILCLGMGLVFLKRSLAVDITAIQEKENASEAKAASQEWLVLVKGAVKMPGIYRLPAGTRVIQAVRKAHPRSDADMMALSLAEFIKDGQTIIVPQKLRPQDSVPHSGVSLMEGQVQININTADASQLDQLPGIGPGLAARVLAYRKEHSFHSAEDLMKVPGIGQKRFEEMKDKVVVE